MHQFFIIIFFTLQGVGGIKKIGVKKSLLCTRGRGEGDGRGSNIFLNSVQGVGGGARWGGYRGAPYKKMGVRGKGTGGRSVGGG